MAPHPLLGFGPFTLDRIRRIVLRSGEPLALTPKAFDILAVLAENGGRVVSKETLLARAWPDVVVDESNLTFQMSALRKALGDKEVIATIPGRGYQLAVPVREVVESEIVLEERQTATVVMEESTPDRSRVWWVVAITVVVVAAVAGLWMARRREPAAIPARIASIAVLPFKPVVAAQRDEALELGMADAVISRISSLRDLSVRPLTAVRAYAGVDQDPIAAGRELRVDAVLDGSILSANDRIRINARLLRVSDGKQIWQGQFDNEYEDIFSLQDAISGKLVDAVTLKLSPSEQRRLVKRETSTVEAYRAYTIGRLHMFAILASRYDAAIESFERAIALDPQYALAWAHLGQTFAQMHISSDRPHGPNIQRARDAGRRAIEIDPEVAEGYAVLGTVAFFYDWDWEAAERNFERARDAEPGRRVAAHVDGAPPVEYGAARGGGAVLARGDPPGAALADDQRARRPVLSSG